MRRVVVYHTYYGCETGCCGHAVAIYDSEEEARAAKEDHDYGDRDRHFEFSHPYGADPEQLKTWARQFIVDALGEEHAADLDWDNCNVYDC